MGDLILSQRLGGDVSVGYATYRGEGRFELRNVVLRVPDVPGPGGEVCRIGDAVIVTTMTATCQIVSRSARRVIHTVDLKRPVRTAALVSGHVLIAIDEAGHVYAYEFSNS